MKHLFTCLVSLMAGLLINAQNEKPFVVPELREWVGKEGVFELSPQTILTSDKASEGVMKAFAKDYQEMSGILLRQKGKKPARRAEISFEIDPNCLLNKGEEAYEIDIRSQIQVKANTAKGLYWATRTLLQMAEQNPKLPYGHIVDYPEYPLRGFVLDVARKFFPMNDLRKMVKVLSYYKMNTFQIHLNDNGFKQYFNNDWEKTYAAFRLESETYPGLTAKDGHYTKEEFRAFQQEALALGVNIIPEIDAPAHTLAFTRYLPEIASEKYGKDHLDLFNPKTYDFLNGLFREYLGGKNPVFIGPMVHIGTDEYSNKDKAVVEKFRYFTDYYIRYIEQFGKRAVVWGALTHAHGQTPVKVSNVLMHCWYNGYAEPKEMIQQSYEVVSIPDGLVYIVPAAGYYYDYLNTQYLYDNWTPAHIGKEQFEERHPQIKGGMFAVWNDHIGNGISLQDVYHRWYPALQTLSAKLWGGKSVRLPFKEFDVRRHSLSEAPGIQLLNRPTKGKKGVVFQIDAPVQGQKLHQKLTDIGYDYRVSFDLLLTSENANGTALFTSERASFYLADPQTGKVGFSREGYDYTFNHRLPIGQPLHLTIEGTPQQTTLFVNGKMVERLSITPHPEDAQMEEKKRRRWVQTLAFPLETLGKFNGKMEHLRVEVL